MINNLYIDLKSDSKERIDACGCLKYTLFLEMELPNSIPEIKLVPTLLNICKSRCSELFTNSGNDIWFLFFGLSTKSSPLSYLDYPTNSTALNRPSLIDMILEHCIISAYHAVLTDLFHNRSITANIATNKLNTSIHLLSENFVFPGSTGKEAKNNARKGQDFKKTTIKHLKKMQHTKQLFLNESTSINIGNNEHHTTSKENVDNIADLQYSLQFAKLWKNICEIRPEKWNINCKKPSLSEWEIKFQNLQEISHKLEHSFSTPIDKIYFKYITERIFGYDLINCLIQNVSAVEATGFHFINSDILNTICQCKILPNTFSRIYFIQYAFEQLLNKPMSYFDYWYHQENLPDRSKYRPALNSVNGMPQDFSLPKWTEQFSYFCNYMAKFIIPIFEWYFLELLLKYVENKFRDWTHNEHLKYAKNILKEYITGDAEKLLKVYPTDTDLTLFRPVEDLRPQLRDLPDYCKHTLLNQIFMNQENMNLNLTLINPEFFLDKKHSERFKPFIEEYRTFIIKEIKALYLDEKKPI